MESFKTREEALNAEITPEEMLELQPIICFFAKEWVNDGYDDTWNGNERWDLIFYIVEGCEPERCRVGACPVVDDGSGMYTETENWITLYDGSVDDFVRENLGIIPKYAMEDFA